MSSNPANQPPAATNSSSGKGKKAMTRGQLAIQAAAGANQDTGEANTANGRKLRDTMAAKNGRVAETILREQTLERELVDSGGALTDGNNAQARLKTLRVPVDAAGRSPSSLVAAASSSPLSERDRFSFSRGPPQTPSRTPSHLLTVAQHQDPPPNPSTRPLPQHPLPTTGTSSSGNAANPLSTIAPTSAPSANPTATVPPTLAPLANPTALVQAQAPPALPTHPGHSTYPPVSARPAPVLPSTSLARPLLPNQPANSLQDPWARTQGPETLTNVPVRIELGKAQDHANPLAPKTTQYVTVPAVTQNGGLYTCKLSDVLGRLADIESPLKERTSKIYRLGPERELLTLGRGDDLTNPSDTRLANNSFLNTHRIDRTELDGMEVFTGVRIFYDHQPSGRSIQHPQDFFEEDEGEASPTPRRSSNQRGRSRSKRSTANTRASTSRSKPHRRRRSPSSAQDDDIEEVPFDPEHELYPFLRRVFQLDPDNLPGRWDVKTAREALERYQTVCDVERMAGEKLRWKIPNKETLIITENDDADMDDEDNEVFPIPEAIRGLSFTKTDLQHIHGFSGETTWWTLRHRWSKSSLKGAKVVQAWVENPDATMQNSDNDEDEEEKYPHLNRIPFSKLKSIIELDRQGKYTRLGPKEDESSDSGERVRRDRGRQRQDRSQERERHRRQSPSSRQSRSKSREIHSSELDNPEPRRAESSRNGGARRPGRR